MYKNRISRTTAAPTICRHPQFFIRRSEIAFDERVVYVESVCAVLNESRFGPGSVSPFVIDQSDRPEVAPVPFYDLFDNEQNGLVPCNAFSPLGRAGYPMVEAKYRRTKQMGFSATMSNVNGITVDYTANQGRGSP